VRILDLLDGLRSSVNDTHDDSVERTTRRESSAKGKAVRTKVPRERHAVWSSTQRTQKPLDLLIEQAQTRVPELVPIRYGRMSASPFAYYRGAALPMAADLSTGPCTGLDVQLCGDAHLSNFGGFASPERDFLFDVNDFDETSPGPFEWDLKRLGASFEIAARGRNFEPKVARKTVIDAMRAYREAIHEFAAMSNLEVWYSRLDMAGVVKRWGSEVSSKTLATFQGATTKAESKDELKAREKLTKVVDGKLCFRSDPPLLVPVSELFSEADAQHIRDMIHEALISYRRTLVGDRRHLLESYELVDVARKVVGVGSVGTRAWVGLFKGGEANDTLILQVKEAEASVLERFTKKSAYTNHGQRVVEGQRLMQAASDIFLGWQRVPIGVDDRPHDYYFRQLWDWKYSVDVVAMTPETLRVYAKMCGWTLARAHARSGDRVAIASYLGSSDAFDRAIGDFAVSYADQNQADHQALVDAIADGTVHAELGI
jgi:uncharacterized protein (DUF2252 family)